LRKREAGQALILVLIILALATLLVIPTLRLTGTSLRSSQVFADRTQVLYAADAAQEYVLWKLLHDGFGSAFTVDGQTGYLSLDVCGVSVNITIIMRAVPGQGGVILSTNDVIQPTKTVSPDTIDNNTTRTITYTIHLEQLSDNNTQGLEVLYDILPDVYGDSDYVTGSSEMRVDGGAWQSVPDPALENPPTRWRLRWPASGNFSSDPGSQNYFYGIRDFNVRQVKELRFQMLHEFKGSVDNNRVHCNWVVLKPWNTVSGPQAPLTVGSPARAGVCDDDGLIEVSKVSDPDIIPPGVETDIEYTIHFLNKDGNTHQIEEVIDYLPPGFFYSANLTTGITTSDPDESLEDVNGVERWKLHWVFSPAVQIQASENLTLTFLSRTTKDVSGSYYNEVQVISEIHAPPIFSEIGISDAEYYTSYSWTSGTVTVPTYDSSANATGLILDANMALTLGSVGITSYQIR